MMPTGLPKSLSVLEPPPGVIRPGYSPPGSNTTPDAEVIQTQPRRICSSPVRPLGPTPIGSQSGGGGASNLISDELSRYATQLMRKAPVRLQRAGTSPEIRVFLTGTEHQNSATAERVRSPRGARTHGHIHARSHGHSLFHIRARSRSRAHGNADAHSRDDRNRSGARHSHTERHVLQKQPPERLLGRSEPPVPGRGRETCWLRIAQPSVWVF